MTGLNRRHLILGAAATPAVAAAAGRDDPARAVLTRLVGRGSEAFQLVVTPDSRSTYAYGARRGRVTVTASSTVAALYGAYAYLKDNGLAHASWDGHRADLPRRLPDAQSGPVESPFPHRLYLNTCTFGYTTPFWDWPRLRQEIDWMALHGIDMPLAMEGQEWVWRLLWQEEGLSDGELDA